MTKRENVRALFDVDDVHEFASPYFTTLVSLYFDK
jgi:hypothetical protein